MSTIHPSAAYVVSNGYVSEVSGLTNITPSIALYLEFTLPQEEAKKYIKNPTIYVWIQVTEQTGYSAYWKLSAAPLTEPLDAQVLFRDKTLPHGRLETSELKIGSVGAAVQTTMTMLHTGAFVQMAWAGSDRAILSSDVDAIALVYTPQDALLVAKNLRPNNYANKDTDITLSWDYSAIVEGAIVTADKYWELQPASAEVQWKNGSSGTVHTLTSSDGKTCVVPAGTFPETESLMYRVQITDNAGNTGDWSDWAFFASEKASLSPTNEAPDAGYLNRFISNIFTWGLAYNRPEYSGLTQTAATVEWRVGSSGTVHSISAGTAQSVIFPANTFPATSEIQWRVKVTDSGGTTTAGSWKALNTTESTPVVTAVSPATAYVTGDQPVRFSWVVSFAQGGTQKTYTLQALANGAPFTVKTGTQTENYVDLLPTDLPSGQIQWRVKVTNMDDEESEWSNYLNIIVIAPPPAPSVTVTEQNPMAAVSWESTGQQSYELRVNGVSTGTFFGTDKAYRVPFPLPDGENSIAVRVQNNFGFWSAWSEVSVTVANTPGASFPLSVSGLYGAALTWAEQDGAVSYAVYRDGLPLIITADTAYTDHGSIGTAIYTVRAIMSDGTYAESQPAVAQISPDCPVVSDGSVDWLQLRYTAESAPSTSVFAARDVSMTAYSDYIFPVAERSIHRSMTVSLSVAFLRSDADAARLEALLGEPVYFKDQYGNNIFGVFASYEVTENTFIRAYRLTLEVTDA